MAERERQRRLGIFARSDWQMSLGERAALEGVVAQLSPRLAIEIGTAEGSSLECIASHSAEVHAVDLTDELLASRPANATFHKGDSKVVLPELLDRFASEGRNVDLALVDGDHSPEGVAADLTLLLGSEAVSRTLILLHDSFNPDVRAGIESVNLADHPKVAGFDLDFVPGRLAKLGPFADQFLGGFALVDVDGRGTGGETAALGVWSLDPDPILFHDAHGSMQRASQLIDGPDTPIASVTAPRIPLDAAHLGREQLQRELDGMRSSWSWRLTRPLRAIKARIR